MKVHRRRWPQALTLTLAGLLALLAGQRQRTAASSIFVVDGVKVVWSSGESVRYLSPSTFPPGSATELLIFEAMALWNIVPAADFEYFFAPLEQDFPIDHFDGFNDTAAVPADQLDPGVLGVTFLVNDGATWFDMDVLFSDSPAGAGYTFAPQPTCDVVSDPTPTNGFSFLLIATHELGHALGLGHDPIGNEPSGTGWFVATMNPRYPSGGPIGQHNIVELHTDDRNGLRLLYPHSGLSEPPMVDLASAGYATGNAIGQAVPMAAQPSQVFPGEEVILRLLIENFGTTNEFFVRQGFYLSIDDIVAAGDQFLGSLTWDIAFQDAFEVDVAVPLPADMLAGSYFLGAALDDLDQIIEEYEDNNIAVTCEPLIVAQRAPLFDPLPQQVIPCGQAYTGPTPAVALPINMGPMTWSLDNAPSRMMINPSTGVISWPNPVPSTFPYAVTLRGTNMAGSSTQTLFLGVEASPPQLVLMPDDDASCDPAFVSAAPRLTSSLCMSPILNWSLDMGPPGMTIDASTGRVSWLAPVSSPAPYTVTIRATNAVGNGSATWLLHAIAGDMDGSGAVDLADFGSAAPCLSGPGRSWTTSCSCIDADFDGDIDLFDVAAFQIRFHK